MPRGAHAAAMRPPHAVALGFALLATAQLSWSTLADPTDGLVWTFLAVQAVAWAAAAAGVLLGARARALTVGGLAGVAAADALFLGVYPEAFGPASKALMALSVAGAAAMAWRASRAPGDLRALLPGAAVGAAHLYGFVALDLLAGDAFLLRGYWTAVPGWAIALWGMLAARAEASRASPAQAVGAHAGARP